MDNKDFKESSSSIIRPSRLVELFASRAAGGSLDARAAMLDAVTKLRRRFRHTGGLDERMRFYLHARKIVSVRIVDDLGADGALEPIGSRYVHGFNILLPRPLGHTRLRFTLAHELCHTFFYEFVPETKFAPHAADETEERLCNFGAAELLMPSLAVQKSAAQQAVCIESLRSLAEEFSVSVSAMFLRLRTLKLWSCVLSEWQRMLNGTFELTKIYGGKQVRWQWDDPLILREAWESHRSSFGSTFVRYEVEEGQRYYHPAIFQVQRIGNRVLSLWGSQIRRPASLSPLLGSNLTQ